MIIDASDYRKYINIRNDINKEISRIESNLDYIEFELNGSGSEEAKELIKKEEKLYHQLDEVEDIINQIELIKQEIYQTQYT